MDKAQRQEFEAQLSEQWERDEEAEDFTRVVEQIMRGYGPEILGYLVAVSRDEERAWDAFSIFSENLWKTMGTFQRRSTFRTWAYMLARQALYQVRVSPPYRQVGDVALDDLSNISKLAERIRMSSMVYLKEVKDRFSKLRETLTEEEQTLMLLRVDRGMSWPEIAQVMHTSPATLRQRFKRLKDNLKAMARRDGLIDT